jgi:ribose-phosphate pyrophosphokinase
MDLLLRTDALKRSGIKDIDVFMPYVPYARQDRVMTQGEPLSIKVFTDIINAQQYRSVTIWDPHSDVAPALLNNCHVVTQETLVSMNAVKMGVTKNTILVCPDAGARKKVLKVSQCGFKQDILFADKVRDVSTGKITGTTLGQFPFEAIGARDFLIVDDILDGGATFIELAKHLRPLTTGKIKLYVTHGIFSKGTTCFEGIDEIYVANSWVLDSDDGNTRIIRL